MRQTSIPMRQRGRGRELFEYDPSTWVLARVCMVYVCAGVFVCMFNGGKCQNSQLTQRHVRRTLKYLLLYHVGSWRRRRRRICNLDTRSAYLDDYPAQQHLHLALNSPRYRANYSIMRWSWKLFIETSFNSSIFWTCTCVSTTCCVWADREVNWLYVYVIHSPFAPVSADTTTSVICKSFLWYTIYIWHMIDLSINNRHGEYFEYFGQYDTIPCVIIE